MDRKTRKKLDKEIHKAQKDFVPEDSSVPLEDHPKKSELKGEVEGTIGRMREKKAKLHSNPSKRTTPGDVDHRESPPASIHPESTRWKKTLDMQNNEKRKNLTRKDLKRKK